MTNKTYSSKANANRAARKNTGGDEGSFEVYEVDGRWTYREIDAETEDMTDEDMQIQMDITEAPHHEADRECNTDEADREATVNEDGRRRKSLVDNPTSLVWHMAEEMKAADPNVRRKDVINACIERGVAYYTARSQYQMWYTATKAAEQQAMSNRKK